MLETKLSRKSSGQTIGELLKEFREAVQSATGEKAPKESIKKGKQPTPKDKRDFSKSVERKP
jgi:hypothetical protein